MTEDLPDQDTELLQSLEKIQESEMKFQSLADSVNVMISIVGNIEGS
ncbi:MAG: hypothetical protein ACP5D6_09395 [Kosmotogaceae bacterium]